ncbi:hypothetical protein FHS23_000429 [Prauserella isguenensis]|uniref:Uncharacterized protein n=1 Tax=Prauserella isguenensis TaxID=1470180 RepID=A0A839RWJ4_9PSEU|nr:hypothetical protein [Prauserella isguenensis]MBB3049434.1 hypothetical protein [Prauserella isguenensis]
MAPTAPRPTPHEDALLDRTGIICASGHGPAAPPTPGMNRSGAAGFVAFVVMVLAAVTGVSGLDGDGAGSRLVAGDEATEAAPQVPDGTGSDEQGGDVPGAGTDEKPGDAPQRRKATDVPAGPVSPDAGAHSDEVRVSDDTAIVPADDGLARGLEAPVPVVARADPAAAGPNVTDSEVAAAQDAWTAARDAGPRKAGAPVEGAWTVRQDPSARDRSSVERRVQRFGEELRRGIENHATRHYDFPARHTDARGREGRDDGGGVRGFEAILNTVADAMHGHGPVQHTPKRQAQREQYGSEHGADEPAQSGSDVAEDSGGGNAPSRDARVHRGDRDMSPRAVGERWRHGGGLPGADAGAHGHGGHRYDGQGGHGGHRAYEETNRAYEPRVDAAHDEGTYGSGAHDVNQYRDGAYGGHGYGGYGAGW